MPREKLIYATTPLNTRFNATVERVRQYEAWQGLAQTSHLSGEVEVIAGRLIALQVLLNNPARSPEQNEELERLQGQLAANEDLSGCLFTKYDGEREFTIVPLVEHIRAVLAGTSQTYIKPNSVGGADTGNMLDSMGGVTTAVATTTTNPSASEQPATTTTTATSVAAITTAAAATTTATSGTTPADDSTATAASTL